MVRHYGIYARTLKKKIRVVMERLGRLATTVKEETKKVLDSIKVKCDVCGAIMEVEGLFFPT